MAASDGQVAYEAYVTTAARQSSPPSSDPPKMNWFGLSAASREAWEAAAAAVRARPVEE